MSDRFDLEQAIMNVWGVKEDIGTLHWLYIDGPEGPMSDDQVCNHLMALEYSLELKMQKLWDIFCAVNKVDHHRKLAEEEIDNGNV
jgi:hypothetical protein